MPETFLATSLLKNYEPHKEVLSAYTVDPLMIAKLAAFESRDGFILLGDKELKDMQDYLAQFAIYKDLIPVMTNGNSNYWCLYVYGPLKNNVCYLDHEEPSLEPRFKNLTTFIDAIYNHPDADDLYDFDETAFDYPSRKLPADELQNKKMIDQLLTIIGDNNTNEDIAIQAAFSVMALASPKDIESVIYPFLDHDDMYIQERAIQLLGFHRYKSAVDRLTELATTAKYNGQTAAKIALKHIENA